MTTWLQTHALAVVALDDEPAATSSSSSSRAQYAIAISRKVDGAEALGSSSASVASSSSTTHRVQDYHVRRSLGAFRALRKELLAATAPPKPRRWGLPGFPARFRGCVCDGPGKCAFGGLRVVLENTEFPTRRFRAVPQAQRDARRRSLDVWLSMVHDYFASCPSSLLQDKVRRDDCRVLRSFGEFVDAPAHFPSQRGTALRQPLGLAAWRAHRDEAALVDSHAHDHDSDQDLESDPAGLDVEPDNEEHIGSDTDEDASNRLPRLGVKRMGVETLQTFLEDFGHRLLEQYGQDIAELHEPGLTVARRWEICLYVACRLGHSYGAQMIMFYFTDANVVMGDGTSCLHIAARMGRTAIVKMLLEEGAEVNKANKLGVTPLIAACRNGCVEVTELLVAAGADVSMPSARGTFPLHAAVVSQSIEIVRLLLKCGADVNVKTSSGITPLHFAAKLGSMELSELLLRHHADPTQRTSGGSDVLMIASTNGYPRICELLHNAIQQSTESRSSFFNKLKKPIAASALITRRSGTRQLRTPSLPDARPEASPIDV